MFKLLFVALMSASVCFADVNPQIDFRSLKVGGGSIRATITGIVQDRIGFLWVSTRYGLYRYDGYDFKRISILEGNNATGIIRQLEIAGDGSLWVRSESGEVIRIDPVTNESELINLPSGGFASEIIVDSSGAVWFISDGLDLFRFDGAGGRVIQERFLFQGFEIKVIGIFADENYYYFNTLNFPRMLRCAKSNYICEALAIGIDEVEIWLLKDNRGRYWGRGRGGGIVMMADNQVVLLSGKNTLVEEIIEDEDGGIWIGTSTSGLNYYLQKQSEIIHFLHDQSVPGSIPSNMVEQLWADSSGNVWIGTRNGLVVYNTRPSVFEFVAVDNGFAEPRNITALFVDDQQNFWIGVEDAGLFHRDDNSWTRIDAGTRGAVLAFEQLPDGNLLIATSSGLFRFDAATDTSRLISEPIQVTDVLVTGAGDIWITTLLQGYGKYNFETEKFEYFRPSNLAGGLATGITATALTEDNAGNLWIGFDGHGLIRLSTETGNYIQFLNSGRNPDSISNESVNCVYVDHQNYIWVGTRNGLNRIDPETNIVEKFFLEDGLPDNFICSVIAVDEDDIWISTRAGLARYSMRSGQIVGFDSENGLNNTICILRSSAAGADGTLFFGGVDGITSVNARLQVDSGASPDTVITSVSVFGSSVAQEQLRFGNARIMIPYDQNIFSVEFAAMDFSRPPANRFRYRLKGLEDQFSEASTARIARYSKVPPGDYTFEVFGSNSRGIWSENPASIRLVVIPPFWMTWQFRAIVAIMALALMYGLYKWRTTAIKRQRDLLRKEVIEREIVQKRLLTNRERLRHMASELILAEDRERRRVALILHDQIAQSLIISKTRLDTATTKLPESGEIIELNKISAILDDTIKDTRNLTAEVSPPSLHRFGLEVAVKSLLDQYGAEHGIETAIIHEAKSDLSKDLSVLLYRSVRELLINIIKHAEAKTVVVEIRQKNNRLTVMVQDDGKGFDSSAMLSDESIPKGFGLFSIQERLESLGGKFEIESDEEHGTLIIMEVPISRSSEKDDD